MQAERSYSVTKDMSGRWDFSQFPTIGIPKPFGLYGPAGGLIGRYRTMWGAKRAIRQHRRDSLGEVEVYREPA